MDLVVKSMYLPRATLVQFSVRTVHVTVVRHPARIYQCSKQSPIPSDRLLKDAIYSLEERSEGVLISHSETVSPLSVMHGQCNARHTVSFPNCKISLRLVPNYTA